MSEQETTAAESPVQAPVGMETGISMTEAARRLSERFGASSDDTDDRDADIDAEEVASQQDAEPQDAATDDDEEATPPPEDDSEASKWDNLSELLEAGDVKPDALPVTITVDGEPVTTTLAEVMAGYSREADYTRKTQALADQRRAFEQERTERMNAIEQHEQQATAYANLMDDLFAQQEQAVHAQYQHFPWQEWAAKDPGRYAMEKTNYQSALQNISVQKSQAQAAVEHSIVAAAQARQDAHRETIAEQEKVMLEVLPEWANAETRTKEAGEVQEYLKSRGAPKSHFDAINADALALSYVRDSMLYRRAKQGLKKARDKGNGKALTPGKSLSPRQVQSRSKGGRVNAARQKLNKSHSMDDAAKVLSERWS